MGWNGACVSSVGKTTKRGALALARSKNLPALETLSLHDNPVGNPGRKALERRARDNEALSAMGVLAMNLAHEIRNPLNAAVLQLHLLSRNVEKLELTEAQLAEIRQRLTARGLDVSGASDEDIRTGMQFQAEQFRDAAPLTAAAAATIILDGVRAGEWRILVGDDAVALDAMVREFPHDAYDADFMERLRARGMFDMGL